MPSLPVSVGTEVSRGFRDSWAGQAEPAPPLRSANPWQGAHRAPGLHLLRPEAGNARPTALTFSGSVVYRVVSHRQPNLHTSLHRARGTAKENGVQRKDLGQRRSET